MKVLFDLSYIREDPNIGLANFAFNLLEGMRLNNAEENIVVLTEEGYTKYFRNRLAGFKTVEIHSKSLWKLPFTRGFLSKKQFESIIRKEKIDLVLYCYVCDRSLFTKTVPTIGVLHDIAQFVDQPNVLLRWRFNIGGIHTCNMLDHIVTITQHSKKEILDFKHIKPEVSVIYVNVRKPASLSKNIIEPPYILTVNRLVPYKNIFTLVRAFNILKDEISHDLYIKGRSDDSSYWNETILPFITVNNLTERVKLIETPISDLEIDKLYTDADLFITTSTMEGFGATPIEAGLCGTPVISTSLPTLYESTRGMATYYEPFDDAEKLAEKIRYVLANKESIDTESIKEEYEKAYSCENTAKEYISLIESISKKKF